MIQVLRSTKKKEAVSEVTKKFLTFGLGSEVYAIDILKVQEIKANVADINTIKIAKAPAYFAGLVDLHGVIVPIIDLRIFYNLITNDRINFKVFIILNVNNNAIGIVIDEVLELIELTEQQVKSPPDIFSVIDKNFISGLGYKNNQVYIILDVEKMILKEFKMIEDIKKKSTSN